MSIPLFKQLHSHYMTICYQKNGSNHADVAMSYLDYIANNPCDREWGERRAIEAQWHSAMEYKFARERMGLED